MTIRELINCCDNIKDKYVLKIIDYLLYYQILENPNMMVLDVDIDHFEIRKDTIPFHCIWIKKIKRGGTPPLLILKIFWHNT